MVKFVTSGRQPESDLNSLARPLPASLASATGDVGARHEILARRYGETTARVVALRRKLEETQRADDLAAREAIVNGEAVPKSEADRVKTDLEAAEREQQLAASLIPASANDLLAAAQPLAAEIADQTEMRANAVEQQAIELLEQARQLLVDADALRAESAYVASVAEGDGFVRPWTGPRGVAGGTTAVSDAIRAVQFEIESREERRVEHEREAVALNAVRIEGGFQLLPPPPVAVDSQ